MKKEKGNGIAVNPEAVNKHREKYKLAESAVLDAALELNLAEQGIDVEKVAKRDFDCFHRANIRIDDIKSKAQEKINKIQQEAGLEIQGIHIELGKLNNKIRQEQGMPLLPIVEDMKIETAESQPDAPAGE